MTESQTGGVKPMAIAGRMVRERERLLGMSTEERAWRAQWIKDQRLARHEPVFVPELIQARLNPIRRFYRAPLDKIFTLLTPVLGHSKALFLRSLTGKFLMGFGGVYLTAYYFKYNSNDWTRKGGWRVLQSKAAVNKGDPGYPMVTNKKPADYATRGFQSSPI
ncbi:hypothetical protein Bhyg_04531 [Pseudolycoriella hygida]|uniref:NADH dehydrogenase [ubiquinone] 1 beta subcomplex subunit 6 n=1 Tax=Pseudolycoriella hygida TaxID=35572 RepID=A0A9Q0S8J3_9DIPT|nr:hypothetical protein Bhyg_04531 [Pseudolycoriella hygida]